MDAQEHNILVVDDEEMNLDILVKQLNDNGYKTVSATNGQEALDILEKGDHRFHVILLDRMMPVMDGMAFFRKIKNKSIYKNIPVIMQTAAAESTQVKEGIDAGVYYYLTKPFAPEVLLAIVSAAISDRKQWRELEKKVEEVGQIMGLVEKGIFTVRTLEEAKNLAAVLAFACPNPKEASVGISELIVNGIEHGNLGINHDLKGQLVLNETWEKEIAHRLTLPENKNKKVKVQFEVWPEEILVTVKDEGNGFNWEPYLELDPARATNPNGRGIALAKLTTFDDLQYKSPGNEVMGIINVVEPKES